MVDFTKHTNIFRDNDLKNSTVQQTNIGSVGTLNSYETAVLITTPSIIQEVLEGIIDLSMEEIEATELDTQLYTIESKIDYNEITVYKVAYDIYMSEKQLIEHRLKSLDNGKNPLASQKLYKYVQRIYGKHCYHKSSDQIIECICEEISNGLLRVQNISLDDVAVVPYIVFYVFSKCHIFKKPI
tara:strand:+ start:1674 stop:2225 length:552 start_codon:yes stop_codon:yes gene_type:complete